MFLRSQEHQRKFVALKRAGGRRDNVTLIAPCFLCEKFEDKLVDNGPKRATMAVHGPSGVGVVAASTYPASGRRAILVLPTVIKAVFISQCKRLSTRTCYVWTRASD
jgi:hypothetical protein